MNLSPIFLRKALRQVEGLLPAEVSQRNVHPPGDSSCQIALGFAVANEDQFTRMGDLGKLVQEVS